MDFVRKVAIDIKNLKIQGAQRIAEAAIVAWKKAKNKNKAYRLLVNARPTEPMLRNVLKLLKNGFDPDKLLTKLEKDKEKIRKMGSKKIKDNYIVYTHCHSSTVVSILKEAKRKRKKFLVHLTETRPLYQGRITAKELSEAKIPVVLFVDSAARIALKKADIMVIGADAITAEGIVINKIGSELFAEVAYRYDIPVYVCTHSFKFDPMTYFGWDEKIEKRFEKEVWKNPPKGVRINNFAFEKIKPQLITGIISELGVLKPEVFVEAVIKKYPWMVKE